MYMFVFGSAAEIDSFFENNKVDHLALVFETEDSYVGREVNSVFYMETPYTKNSFTH